MKHTYRDPKTGRFATVPPPPPAPPRWADGRFISRDKWTPKHTQEGRYTGRAATTAMAFTSRDDAAATVKDILNGEQGDFLAAAYTLISVRRTEDGWALRIEYRNPAAGEGSP